MIPDNFRNCPVSSGVLLFPWMVRPSDTLKVGDRAPEFALFAANMNNVVGTPLELRLDRLLGNGPLVIEFLRGTW